MEVCYSKGGIAILCKCGLKTKNINRNLAVLNYFILLLQISFICPISVFAGGGDGISFNSLFINYILFP